MSTQKPTRRSTKWHSARAAWLLAGFGLVVGFLFAGTAFAQRAEPQAAPDTQATPDTQAPGATAEAPGVTVETHHETVPNPVYESKFSVTAQCQTSEQPCDWDNPSTWSTGLVPGLDTLVIVDGFVQVGSQDAVAQSIGIYPGGKLTFDEDVNTKLTTADLVVFDGGTLHVGTADSPISNTAQAEVVFRNMAFDETDPTQILRGLVATGGTVRISGSPLDSTYLRAEVEPTQGSSTITTAESMSAAGWSVGDVVTIPTSQQCRPATGQVCESQTEDRTIVTISGNTATLDAPLSYDHPGARDINGQIDFMAHVINKTRNVIFRSEDPNSVRGHMLFHGRADVDLRYAEVRDMGRTNIEDLGPNNQKGRYPLHAHHLIGPINAQANGYQFTFIGNSIDFGEENVDQGRKWGISIHGSHYGLIEDNIVDHASGAAIVTESGSETGNMFRGNFAVRVVGGNGERLQDVDPFDGTKSGRAGVGFWFNGGGRNSFRDNVAADISECTWCFGFKFDNLYADVLLFPNEQGSDPMMDGGETIDGRYIGIDDFENNEAYAVPNGVTVWWICARGETPVEGCSSYLDSFSVWHHHRWGYYGYETNNMTLDGFVIRGDVDALSNQFEQVRGLEFSDYMQRNLLVSNADIQNMETGMRLPTFRDVRNATGPNDGWNTFENSYIVATTGIGVWAPSSVNGSAADLAAQSSIIRNVTFDYPSVVTPGVERGYIVYSNTSLLLDANKTNFTVRNDVLVENYNQAPGVDGDDFYMVPQYQGANACDASIGNCNLELTASYTDIGQAHIFALAGNTTGPTPVDPIDNEPVEPEPVEPEPVEPQPVDPEPTEPEPVFFAPDAPNLLTNGGFDADRESWNAWSLDYNHQISVSSSELQMAHVNASGRNFSQLSQRIGGVNVGDTYRLRFDVRSNQTNASIDVLFQQAGEPWARITSPEQIQVDKSTRSIEVLLTPTENAAETTFMFQLQDGDQTIWIDNVELVKASKPTDIEPVDNPVAGPNLIANGGFDSELDPWNGWSLDYNHQLAVENGEAQMAHINASGRNFTQFSQRVGQVQAGDTFALSFDVRSDQANATIDVLFQQAGSPWARLTAPNQIQVDQTSQAVEVLLTVNGSAAETAFMFQLQDEDQTIWIDNVELTLQG